MNTNNDNGFVDADGNCLFNKKGPELLVDLANQCGKVIAESLNVDPDKAFQVGKEVAEHMAKHWGGSGIYFPMGMTYKLSQRDRQIYSEFKGNNHFELAKKYEVSVIWIYKIIRTVQKEELASRQKDMFGQ